MKPPPRGEAATLRLRVQPRASRDEVVGWREGSLRVRVTAAPVGGGANRAVSALVARCLGLRAAAVSVVHGERGRDKLVRIEGLTLAEVRARLSLEESVP
jgi:uncharacterized protein (TIGR00251 family)